jgi:methyl-accepting chemotaxis protein
MMKSLWTILVLAALLLLYPTEAFLRPAAVSSSHVTLHAQFQPSSKARTKVAIDPKTGLYRPIKQVKGRDPNSNDIGTTWDGLKEAFYKSVDSLSSLPTVVDKLSQSRKDEEDIASSAVFSGYADIERELGAAAEQPLKRKVDTPVGKILKRSTAPSSLTSQPLIPPTNLEKAKAFLWKSVDATSFTQDKQQEMEKDASVTIMSSTMESFQPAVRARLIASDEFLQAMEDLESSNPVVRLAAGRRIRKLAQQQQQQIRKGPDVFDKFKAKLYRALDSVEATGRQIAALPSKAVSAYEATADTAQRTVQAARQVPSKVQSQVQAVQQSIQDTVEATQQTVETVQRLPSDVQTSIQTTKQNVQDKVQATVDTAQRVQSTVQSVTTQSKILLGLEKPQPKPPTEPPPSHGLPAKPRGKSSPSLPAWRRRQLGSWARMGRN